MVEYRFDSGDNIHDHVPDDADVESVRYIGGTEIVTTSEDEKNRPSEYEPYEMGRAELYSLAKRLGVEVNWTGEDAHDSDEMAQKIEKEAYGGEN